MSSQAVAKPPTNEPTKANAPPANADLKTTWAFLEQGVDHIMTRLHTGMSYTYYILLYSTTYNYCTSVPKPSTSFPISGQRNGANLLGADLYKSLTSYFTSHLRALKNASDEYSDLALLQYYAREWDRYTTGANYVNRLFTYLNRHWVRREKDEGRKGIYTIYTLALVQWKNEFFKKLTSETGSNLITNAVLRQIELARHGEEIDGSLIKRVVESYVFLGLDEADAQRQNLDVYRDFFQTPFIAATSAFYKAESEAFVAANSVSDYLKKAEDRLAEEDGRVTLILHNSTRKELKEKCEHVLIRSHQEMMWEEFQVLLEADRAEDLARMYRLLSRITDGLEPLRKKFEEHVAKAGDAAVLKITPAPGSVNETGKAETLDPKAYIEALLSVYRKYNAVVHNSFRGEAGFVGSLDRACNQYCNTNAACQTSSKCPELLASYVDSLLKKNQKDLDPEGLEAALAESMIVFKYITDKDVYQKFYQKNLARRLVGQMSASDDSEASMISKLKESCGFDYTAKLTRMFTDVSLSRDLTDKFKENLRKDNDSISVDASIMVLGTNVWPLQPPSTDFSVPREILPAYEKFLKYYSSAHTGRKLVWLWHVCKNELRTNYLSQKYIFMTSAFQMAILVQYNENDSLTFADLMTATKMSEAALKPQLGLLVKAKVLLQEDDTYDINMNFKSKKIRVNLNQAVRSEQKVETTEVLQAVDEDRKFVYQATIVRLMKARKTMKHQALIQEVTGIISTKFTPKVSDMKKAIDHLLDKEYLERVEGTKDTYNYLA